MKDNLGKGQHCHEYHAERARLLRGLNHAGGLVLALLEDNFGLGQKGEVGDRCSWRRGSSTLRPTPGCLLADKSGVQ
jgi:hypothetical protein